jgi:hypothetical protein
MVASLVRAELLTSGALTCVDDACLRNSSPGPLRLDEEVDGSLVLVGTMAVARLVPFPDTAIREVLVSYPSQWARLATLTST